MEDGRQKMNPGLIFHHPSSIFPNRQGEATVTQKTVNCQLPTVNYAGAAL
jgi:hypothetical protein